MLARLAPPLHSQLESTCPVHHQLHAIAELCRVKNQLKNYTGPLDPRRIYSNQGILVILRIHGVKEFYLVLDVKQSTEENPIRFGKHLMEKLCGGKPERTLLCESILHKTVGTVSSHHSLAKGLKRSQS